VLYACCMVQTRYLQLALVLWGMVGVATARAQTPGGETPPPAAVEPGIGSGSAVGPGGPVGSGGPVDPGGAVGPVGSGSVAPGADPSATPAANPSFAPSGNPGSGPGFGVSGQPQLVPLSPPLNPLVLRRFRTGRALYGVGTALGLVGSGLTVASIIVTAVYGLDASSGQSTALIGPSLAYAGSGATGAGFIFGATGLGLQHSALDLVGRDPGRGMYAAGTLFGILGLCGIGTSYFFGLTHVVDHSTEIAFGTSIAASAFLTIGGLLYFSDINRLAAAYRRLTTF